MRKICLFLISVLTLLCFSCRKFVSNDFPSFISEPTINCILIDGQKLVIHLSMSKEIDNEPLSPITNANIDLYINDRFTEKLKEKEQGFYTSNSIIEHSKSYKCKIAISGFDTIICQETLPEPIPIMDIEHVNIAGKNEEGTSYPAIKISFPNNEFSKNFYEIAIIYEINIDSTKEVFLASIHTISDPLLLNEGLPIALFSNETITDSIYQMTLNYTTGQASSTNGGPWRTNLYPFTVELRSVTFDYFRFVKQNFLYKQGISADGLINNVTAFPVYSNIDHARGIFAGYSSYKSPLIAPENYEN